MSIDITSTCVTDDENKNKKQIQFSTLKRKRVLPDAQEVKKMRSVKMNMTGDQKKDQKLFSFLLACWP